MKKPQQPPATPKAEKPPVKAPAPAKAASSPLAARAAARKPAGKPQDTAPLERPTSGSPRELVNYLAGQIQHMSTRLEGLREQGAGQTTEFKHLEQMLISVQDKLIQAQGRLGNQP